jgi:hypothetical protein
VPLPEEKPTLTIHQLLTVVRPDIAETSKNFRSVHYKEIGPTLVNMETAQAASSFKFGVLFVKNGQTKEEDMFGNGTPIHFMLRCQPLVARLADRVVSN